MSHSQPSEVDRPRLRNGVIRRGASWSYVIRVTDERGISRPRWVGGFATEAAAKAARDAARLAASRGEFVDRSQVTLGDYLDQWLDGHGLEVKPKTLSGYRSLTRCYVEPHIGKQRMQSLTPAMLTKFYGVLLARGGQNGAPLSTRTVGMVHALLRKALGDAVHVDRLLPHNPAAVAKKPRPGPRRVGVDVWNAEQLRAFLDHAQRHRLYAFYRLAAYSGARRGEMLSLRWADVELERNPSIRIRRSTDVIDGAHVEGSAKSGKERRVSIDSGTVEVLRAHRVRQELDRQKAQGSWVDNDLVFRMEIGAPLYPTTVTALMRILVAEHNADTSRPALPPMRLHDLRHIHATLLLRAGSPVHVVSARLGHADPAITLRVYAHVQADQASEVADIFAAAVAGDPR